MDCFVGLAVAAAVEAVPVRFPAGGRDRADPGERGERGFPGDPVRVVARGDQQLGGGDDTDALRGE